MSLAKFWQIFDEHLEFIDRVLASRGTPIQRRPWEAAFFFLEHIIIDVSGMTKEELVTHRAFRDMVRHSRRWYVSRFGEALLDQKPDAVTGLVILYDTPFELSVPLTVTRPSRRKGLTALHFPLVVLRSEDSLTFLKTPPNLTQLTPGDLSVMRRKVSLVAGRLRKLHIYTMFANVGEEEGRALAAGIRTSLERGANDICSMDVDRFSTAVWELNFAAEKALKTFLWQKSRPVPRTHDIRELLTFAGSRGLPGPPQTWVKRFPTGEEAIKHRYGELGTPLVHSAIELYRVAVNLVLHVAEELERTVSFVGPGGVVYIKGLWDDVPFGDGD